MPIAEVISVANVGSATIHRVFTMLRLAEGENMSENSSPDYSTIVEVQHIIGRSRASIYNYVKMLHIKLYKFQGNRHKFVKREDVERLQEYLEHPWTIG